MSKDDDDFKKAMEGVKPLLQDKVILRKTPKKILRPSKITETNSTLQDITQNIITSEEKLFFARTGLQYQLIQQLKQGKLEINNSLDLHGLTVNQARQAITIFIQKAKINHDRIIHIIHGKSKSILKNHVNHWLKQIPDVLAFCSAIPKDGGTGAIYILLKL